MSFLDTLKSVGSQVASFFSPAKASAAAPTSATAMPKVSTAPTNPSYSAVSAPSAPKVAPAPKVASAGALALAPATKATTPVVAKKPVDLASLGTKPPSVATSTSTSGYDNLGATAGAVAASAAAPAEKTTKQQISEQTLALIEKMGTQGERTAALQKENQVQDKQARLDALNNRYAKLEAEAQAREDYIRTNPEGKLSGALNAQLEETRRKYGQEKANVALEIAAAQGSVDSARAIVKDSVAAEFEPLKNQISALQTFAQLANNDLTDSEKIQLQGEIQRQNYAYEQGVKAAVTSGNNEAYLKLYQEQGIDAVPVENQAAVRQMALERGVSSATEKSAVEKSTGVLDEIKRLNELKGSGSLAIGANPIQRAAGVVSTWFGASDPTDVAASVDRLKALLSIDAIKNFKGTGAMSDREFAAAGNAATLLRRDMSETQFNVELARIQEHMENAILPLSATPEATKYEILTRRAVEQNPGASPEEIDSLVKQSYDVINAATAGASGNVPQRNNNPGNIKSGGLSAVDNLSTGTDDQGHLVFATPEDGQKALALDLKAKVTGGSKYLPNNPTIAQLGAVYAEDPNWPKSVASILGVPTSTKTQSVDFNELARAVMTQEGYFA